jgi:hypothetical protein
MYTVLALLFHAYSTFCSNSPYFFIPWLLFASTLLLFTNKQVTVIRSAPSLAGKERRSRRLVKSLRRSIPCRSAPDRYFDLRYRAERIHERFVQLRPPDRGRYCPFSPIRCFPGNNLFRSLDVCNHRP